MPATRSGFDARSAVGIVFSLAALLSAAAIGCGSTAIDDGRATAPAEATDDGRIACDGDGPGAAGDDAATFVVFGNEVEMTGVIDGSTPCRLREVLDHSPEVDTIVMIDVPGSADDEANLVAARMVRQADLTTVVVADGGIYSGGTDFFIAGTERIVEAGAEVGVHSWADGSGTEGGELPRDHVAHRLYLDYYAEMGIPADFYWFTLEAAPADDIYTMTDTELLDYEVATDIIDE